MTCVSLLIISLFLSWKSKFINTNCIFSYFETFEIYNHKCLERKLFMPYKNVHLFVQNIQLIYRNEYRQP